MLNDMEPAARTGFAASYLPWGRVHPNSPMIAFYFSLAGEERRGLMLPLRQLREVRWLEEIDGDVSTLWLSFPDDLVEILGAWMEPLRDGLHAGEVDFVREYEAARWPVPPDPRAGEPIVWKINHRSRLSNDSES